MFGFRRSPPAMTAAEAVKLAASGEVVLLDVRNPDEVQQSGKARGALTIPMGEIARRGDPQSAEFDARLRSEKPIAVYCVSGKRSAQVAAALKRFGLQNVHNIGGLGDWQSAGGATEAV